MVVDTDSVLLLSKPLLSVVVSALDDDDGEVTAAADDVVVLTLFSLSPDTVDTGVVVVKTAEEVVLKLR